MVVVEAAAQHALGLIPRFRAWFCSSGVDAPSQNERGSEDGGGHLGQRRPH